MCDARNAALNLVLGHQHEVGQFVDYHDDVAQFVRNLDVVLARDADLLIHLNREAFAGFVERQFGLVLLCRFFLGA